MISCSLGARKAWVPGFWGEHFRELVQTCISATKATIWEHCIFKGQRFTKTFHVPVLNVVVFAFRQKQAARILTDTNTAKSQSYVNRTRNNQEFNESIIILIVVKILFQKFLTLVSFIEN